MHPDVPQATIEGHQQMVKDCQELLAELPIDDPRRPMILSNMQRNMARIVILTNKEREKK